MTFITDVLAGFAILSQAKPGTGRARNQLIQVSLAPQIRPNYFGAAKSLLFGARP